MKKPLIWALVAALVVAAAVAGAWLWKRESKQAVACEVVTADAEAGKAFVTIREPVRVAVLGDSYTAGQWLENQRDGWAFQVGDLVAGVGGTGYVNGGFCGDGTYAERIAAVVDANPETLVIQGGLNDTGKDVTDAADDLLAMVPDEVRVVVVGPVDAPERDDEADVDATLSTVAGQHGAEYVSALDWDLPFLDDGLHLTEAGHLLFAENVTSHL